MSEKHLGKSELLLSVSASRRREFSETEIQRNTVEEETKATLSAVLKEIFKLNADLLALWNSAMKKN